MSQVFVDGKIKRISHAQLCELDELAVTRGWSRERAAEHVFKKPAAKKRAAKKTAAKKRGR